ncbi:MAG: anti-anti-sigma factor [Candidatus Hydrogenedentota bacterium]|nr:MAG: anti-anti-sigma factor [Candidatus Hydrogenedentota bacterium]
MGLEVTESEGDGMQVIRVSGEVDLNTSPTLRTAILGALDKGSNVGVDLSGAAYMDSSGVATLVEGLKSSKNSDQFICLINPSQAVLKVLQLARLDSLFDIRNTEEGA